MTDGVDRKPLRIGDDELIVLAGPSGAGKSTWAARHFATSQVVSSDALRGVVGHHEHDLRASADAFDTLALIVERRLARGLLTVVDSLGMDLDRLAEWASVAARHGRTARLIVFDVDAATCRAQNKRRTDAVAAKVLSKQLERWEPLCGRLLGPEADRPTELAGFSIHGVAPPVVVPGLFLAAGPDSDARSTRGLGFGLVISRFDTPDGVELSHRLGDIAAEAEAAGFESVWVMDHFMQIPQIGREWDPMLDSTTTLGFLAGRTSRVGLGCLVSCVTHRSLGVLGRQVATLDVLSGGRARCGLGLGWFEREHRAMGLRFPPVGDRYELLEDALEFLPIQWGPGAKPFAGRRFSTPEAIGYPRPIQERIPMLLGGSGERRTLRLAAQHADACNLFGEPSTVRHKVDVLHAHCHEFGRDPAEIEVTQLSSILTSSGEQRLEHRLDGFSIGGEPRSSVARRLHAATHEAQIDRFGRLAEAGVHTVLVSLADVGHPESVSDFAPVIDAFGPAPRPTRSRGGG